MCKVLRIARSTYYYEPLQSADETELEDAVETVFIQNRKVYGSRKIKVSLERQGVILSRRKISRIMTFRPTAFANSGFIKDLSMRLKYRIY